MANGQLILIGILIFNVMRDYSTPGSVDQQKSEIREYQHPFISIEPNTKSPSAD